MSAVRTEERQLGGAGLVSRSAPRQIGRKPIWTAKLPEGRGAGCTESTGDERSEESTEDRPKTHPVGRAVLFKCLRGIRLQANCRGAHLVPTRCPVMMPVKVVAVLYRKILTMLLECRGLLSVIEQSFVNEGTAKLLASRFCDARTT